MLQWICSSVIDHRGRQNVVKNISDSLVYGSCATSLFLPLWSITEQTHGNMESIWKGYYKARWYKICYSTHPKLLHAWCYILLKNAKKEKKGSWKNKDKMNFHNRNWNSCKTEGIRNVIAVFLFEIDGKYNILHEHIYTWFKTRKKVIWGFRSHIFILAWDVMIWWLR